MTTNRTGRWLDVRTGVLGSLIVCALATPLAVFAQVPALPCGDIIGPANIFFPNAAPVSTPIADCADPFERTTGVTSPYTLTINGEVVEEGDVVGVPVEGTDEYEVSGTPLQTLSLNQFYRHDGNDYRYVSIQPLPADEAELREYASEFFEVGTDIEPYITAVLAEDYSSDDDAFLGQLYSFLDYVEMNHVGATPKLLPGTYTLVVHDYLLILGKRKLLEQLREYIIPTAHAADDSMYRFTTTFTLVEEVPEPLGASSVLFLPGIQASRLYMDVGGSEDQLWEPNINNDVAALEMSESGVSANDIYTRDVLDEIMGITNVYRSFLDTLEDLETDGVIADSSAFAYDWRYDVFDIAKQGTRYEGEVKSLIAEIEHLASTSYTGKVTIIGHSNGGLIGKALITELENQGKEDMIDKLVMIGTPQLGTPKAIATMLHGYDQNAAFGVVINDDTARKVIRNMPGAYTLLPSNEYFEKAGATIVSADTSQTTASVRAYGQISSQQGMNNFLLDTLDLRTDSMPIYEPSTLNASLLQQSLSTKDELDDWVPPTGINVYEVVGTGNPTIKAFEYQSFPCRVRFTILCTTGTYMKAVPVMTDDGDETVTTLSANGQDGDKVTGYIDLISETTLLSPFEKTHQNLTESQAVQDFVASIIKYPYLAPTIVAPEFVDVSRSYTLIGAHSPVTITVTDPSGRKVGLVNQELREDISGSQYFELGDSKYIVVPTNVSFTVDIQGKADGVYSLTIDSFTDKAQTNMYRYMGASTSPTMRAAFSFTNGAFSSIETDTNGDGVVDVQQTLNGKIIPPPVVYSYELLRGAVKNLSLPIKQEAILTTLVGAAQQWDILKVQKREFIVLDTLKATLRLYKGLKLITQGQYSTLEVIISNLRK